MPVIICTHLPVYEKNDFYNEEDRNLYIELINNFKNIVAVINGHTHNVNTGMFHAGTRSVRYIDGGKSVTINQNKGQEYVGNYKYIKYEFDDSEKKIYFKSISFTSDIDGKISEKKIGIEGSIDLI